jgi:hypothetical protein
MHHNWAVDFQLTVFKTVTTYCETVLKKTTIQGVPRSVRSVLCIIPREDESSRAMKPYCTTSVKAPCREVEPDVTVTLTV